MRVIISDEELLALLQEMQSQIEAQQGTLDKIKNSKDSLILRWQMFLDFILPVQVEAISQYGYTPDQNGLSQFNSTLMHRQQENEQIRKINHDKWAYLLEHCFGVTEVPKLTLDQARDLICDIANASMSEVFLQKIEEEITSLGDDVSLVQKRKKLLTLIMPLHISIMSKHGFKGDIGYVQAQRAILEYYHDPYITDKACDAQKVMFERAQFL